MRHATANNTGNATYSQLLDSCQHSRLKAALASHLPQATARQRYVAVPTAAPAYEAVEVSDAARAYLWVACMSVVSLLSVVVTGTITA